MHSAVVIIRPNIIAHVLGLTVFAKNVIVRGAWLRHENKALPFTLGPNILSPMSQSPCPPFA